MEKRERERERGGREQKENMPDFGDPTFWDDFYQTKLKDAAEFEWHQEPQVLKEYVTPGLTSESVVCDLGCGLSTLGEMLYDSGESFRCSF